MGTEIGCVAEDQEGTGPGPVVARRPMQTISALRAAIKSQTAPPPV
jgi:hypothetical protein